jgi:predicted TIM-barrel fold metal-dependent hydrolase
MLTLRPIARERSTGTRLPPVLRSLLRWLFGRLQRTTPSASVARTVTTVIRLDASIESEKRRLTMAKPVIDMRIRPPFLHKFFGSTPNTPEYDVVRWLNGRVGSNDPDHFTRVRNSSDLLAEMDAAGVTVGVVVARSVPNVRVTNDQVAELVSADRKRLIGVGLVDPQFLGIEAAIAEVRRAVTTLGCRAINVDPGFLERPIKADDPLLYPIYQVCQELDVPAFIMSGPTSPSLSDTEPRSIARVAKAFPKLKIVACHGCYPFVQEMIAVALMHPNVFVSPDMYTFLPGGQLYIEAANGFMKDQLLFGSAYPFKPMKQGVDDFLALGLRPDVIDNVMYLNAASLLKIDVPSLFAPVALNGSHNGRVRSSLEGKIVPTIGSKQSGPAGILHLPRLWSKLLISSAGKLPDDYDACGDGFDAMTLRALRIDRQDAIDFVRVRRPTYMQFEQWAIAKNGGAMDEVRRREHNAAISGYNHADDTARAMRSASGLAHYTDVRDAATLNTVDDLDQLHAQVTAH